MKVLDGLKVEEYDLLIDEFIERQDLDAMSFEALDQAARLQLAEVKTTQTEPNG